MWVAAAWERWQKAVAGGCPDTGCRGWYIVHSSWRSRCWVLGAVPTAGCWVEGAGWRVLGGGRPGGRRWAAGDGQSRMQRSRTGRARSSEAGVGSRIRNWGLLGLFLDKRVLRLCSALIARQRRQDAARPDQQRPATSSVQQRPTASTTHQQRNHQRPAPPAPTSSHHPAPPSTTQHPPAGPALHQTPNETLPRSLPAAAGLPACAPPSRSLPRFEVSRITPILCTIHATRPAIVPPWPHAFDPGTESQGRKMPRRASSASTTLAAPIAA
ncbi:hypothetical protein AOQ84DRAFT_402148 [Glonium stellatum]|uniref:Uncharacterized protein n=1 Tax=Glonium stellatum TaxID=574774 RepID=A0A8E2F507_9PEZI|nr:hypothetical protein AOQ84DRAFT_402148 [Glonium stellatum]